jgi:drug/metabolite transporter (DMT)-like permease
MVLTTILFVAVTATVRYLEGEVPAPQAAFLRYAIGTILLIPSLISLIKVKPNKSLMNKFLLRGLVHSFGVTLWFYAMSVMPVAEVTAIGFLTYIFVSIGACIFFKEKLHKHRITAVIISFIGALIIEAAAFILSYLFSVFELLAEYIRMIVFFLFYISSTYLITQEIWHSKIVNKVIIYDLISDCTICRFLLCLLSKNK